MCALVLKAHYIVHSISDEITTSSRLATKAYLMQGRTLKFDQREGDKHRKLQEYNFSRKEKCDLEIFFMMNHCSQFRRLFGRN